MPSPTTKMATLTEAQVRALRMVQKRDWPAGEPRIGWLHAGTASVLLRRGLIAERSGPEPFQINGAWKRSPIVDLTDAGREALASAETHGA